MCLFYNLIHNPILLRLSCAHEKISFRVSILPTYYGEKIVMRLLRDSISGFTIPQDPEGKVYKYNLGDTVSFELCATFNQASQKNQPAPIYPGATGVGQNWDHSSGRVCFERTIDKQLYPPLVKLGI